MWTTTEWMDYHKAQKSIPVASTIMAIVFLAFLLATFSLKDTAFLFIFGLLSLIASLVSIDVANVTLEEGFCFDNAVEIRGQSRQEGSMNSHCVVQGGLLVYTFFACCTTMIAVTVDWRLKKYPSIQEKMNNSMGLRIGYYAALAVISLILSVTPAGYAVSHELLGFSRTTPYCFIRSYPFGPKNTDIAVVAIPVCICTAIYIIVFVGHDLCGFLRKAPVVDAEGSSQKGTAPEPNVAYYNAVHVATGVAILVSLVIFVPYIASKGLVNEKRQIYLDSLHDWTLCVFNNYVGSDPNHCFDVCGTNPATRPASSNVGAQVVSLTGNMIIVGPAYIIAFLITYFVYRPAKYAKVDVVGQTKMVPVAASSPSIPPANFVGQEAGLVVATPMEEDAKLQAMNENEVQMV
jgi:hypothetical protein